MYPASFINLCYNQQMCNYNSIYTYNNNLFWRSPVRASSYDSNNSTNKMQQFYKFQ